MQQEDRPSVDLGDFYEGSSDEDTPQQEEPSDEDDGMSEDVQQ